MVGDICTRLRLLLTIGLFGGLALLLVAAVKTEPVAWPWEYASIGMVYGTFLGEGVLAAGWTARQAPAPLLMASKRLRWRIIQNNCQRKLAALS